MGNTVCSTNINLAWTASEVCKYYSQLQLEKIEHRAMARGIFSTVSGSQLTVRESWDPACLQVLSIVLPWPTSQTHSKPEPETEALLFLFRSPRWANIFLYPNWLCCQNQQGGTQTRAQLLTPPRSWMPQSRRPAGMYCCSFPIPMLDLTPHGNPAMRAEHISFARDSTLTHNLKSRRLTGFDMVQENHCSHLARQENCKSIPVGVSLLPQLSKKHWWGKSRAKQQELQQLPMASCFLRKDDAEEPLGLKWWGEGQSMMQPNRPCCIFCPFKFHL